MLERVLSDVPSVAVKPKRWRRRLVELLTGVLGGLDSYPGMATVALVALARSDPSFQTIRENALELLRAGGVPEQTAAWSCDALLLHTVAAATQTDRAPEQLAFVLSALIQAARDA
jgi:hypothetical protein